MKKKVNYIILLCICLSFGCTHIDFRPELNSRIAREPVYNFKIAVLNFEDARKDDEKYFDDYFNGEEIATQYAEYLAKDLERSNLSIGAVYIDAGPKYSPQLAEQIKARYDVDLIITGRIKRWELDSSFSYWNCLYLFGGAWWVAFNALGIPLPPFVGKYNSLTDIEVELYVPGEHLPINESVRYKGETFYSPTTFWYHLVTAGKLEELLGTIQMATLELEKDLSRNYQLQDLQEKMAGPPQPATTPSTEEGGIVEEEYR
jgi:hypothetical protein